MLAYVIVFGILIATCYWIIIPLLNEKDHQNGLAPKPEDILEKLKHKKDGVYATLRELEFDLSMGKLSEEDFQILKRQYVQEAAGYMKKMDELEAAKVSGSIHADRDVREEIEQEVNAVRSPASTKRMHIYCTSCGEKAAADSRYCTACGSPLDKHSNNDDQEEI